MSISRAFFTTLLLTWVLALMGGIAHAQNDPIFEEGFKPFGSFQAGDIDTVNILNRELNLHIPLYSLPQRGGKLNMGFYLPYQANLWVPWQFDSDCSNTCYMYTREPNLIGDTGSALFMYLERDSTYPFAIRVTSADGATHPMGVLSSDGTGYHAGPAPTLPATCPYTDKVTDRNGITFKFGCTTSQASSYYEYYEDPNGNKITQNFDSYQGRTNKTDSMGRIVPLPGQATTDFSGCTGPLPTVSAMLFPAPGLGGVNQVFKYCYATTYIQNLNLCGNDLTRCMDGSTGSFTTLQSIVLPNLTSWSFTWDSADPNNPNSVGWDDLVKITFPTGGTVSYTWATSGPIGACSTGYGWGGPIVRVVTSRTVDANDGQGPHTWTYTKPSSFVTNVQDPLGNQTVHTFSVLSTGTGGPNCSVHETLTQSYQGTSASGTLLQTLATDYVKAENYGTTIPVDTPDFVVSRVTTTLENGQQKKVEMDYNFPALDYGQYPLTDGNVVAQREYDYGLTLLRTTTKTYATTNSNYLNNNLLDLVSSVKIQNGSGTQQAYTTFGYDEYGLTASGITTQHDLSPPNGTYRGNLTSVHKWLNGTATSTTSCPITINNGYAVSYNLFFDTGTRQKATDPCGTAIGDAAHTTVYGYDSSGNYFSQVTYPSTATQHIEVFNFDFNTGLLTSKTDQNSRQTSFGYDSMLRLTSVSYPDGGSDIYTYTDTTPKPYFTLTKAITSGSNFVESGFVDGLGRPIQTKTTVPSSTCPTGYSYVDTAYDNDGRKFSTSNPYCTVTDTTYGLTKTYYDALNRPCLVVPPDGTTPSSYSCPATANDVLTTYSGPCTTVNDQAGQSRKSCTDGLGRMTGVWEDPGSSPHLNFQTSYTYDALDNLLSVTQSGSRQRTFTYNSLSWLTQAANPESGTTSYTYDANGNIRTKTDSRGVTTTSTYDVLNRLTGKTYSDGTLSAGFIFDVNPYASYANATGRLVHMTNFSNASRSLSYDPMGRVVQQSDCTQGYCAGGTHITQILYDFAGNLTSLTYPSGRKVTYQYNNVMQPTQVRFDSFNGTPVGYNYLSTASYAPTGGPSSLTLGNGAMESTSYNKRLQPCNFQVTSGATSWLNRTNNFYPTPGTNCLPGTGGNNGNVISIIDNLQSNRSQSFGYDSLNRITSAQTQGTSGADCWAETFGYDAWANLLSTTATRPACPMTQLSIGVNTQNRVTNAGISYDAAGDMLTDGINTYTYDAENRISTVNGTGATYVYYANGQRSYKQSNAGTTEYIYFDAQPIAERNASGMWNDYIYAGGKRLAVADGMINISISNGGFEQGLTNWGTYGSTTVVTNAANAHSGSNYLQISAAPGNGADVLNQYIAVQTGQQVTFGGWVNLQSGGGGALGWWLAVYDSNHTPITYTGTPNPTSSGWTFQSATYTVPTGAAYIAVYAQVYLPGSSTTIWVDDGFVNDGTSYYHADHLGSARLMTGVSGGPIWSATYLPFGQEWNPLSTANHYKFTGKERDSESGLDDFGARYMSSQYGRFMTPDPENAGADPYNPQSWNGYSYVLNNPLNAIDPDGLSCIDVTDSDGNSHQADDGDGKGCGGAGVKPSNPNDQPGRDTQQGVQATVTTTPPSFFQNLFAPATPRYVEGDVPLPIGARTILDLTYQNTQAIANASDVAACTAAGLVTGQGPISPDAPSTTPPVVTHGATDLVAKGLESDKTATFAARSFYAATDARFTAFGKYSKVLVPKLADAMHPALAVAGKTLNAAGWAYTAYEGYETGTACAERIK